MKAAFFWVAILAAMVTGCSSENAEVAKAKAEAEAAKAAQAKTEAELARIKAEAELARIKSEGEPKKTQPKTPAVVDPKKIVVPELMGTLEVEAVAPSNCQGWFYINGEWHGELPFTKTLQLVAGEYEVRIVLVRPGAQIHRVSGKRVVEGGKKTECKLSLIDPRFEDYPSRWRYPGWLTVSQSREYGRGLRPVWVFGAETPAVLEKLSDEVQKESEKYLGSAEWKPLTGLVHRSRQRFWILDFPDELGGKREVDAKQLKLIGDWLVGQWEMRLDEAAARVGHRGVAGYPSDLVADAKVRDTAEFKRAEEGLKKVNSWRTKQRQRLEKAINDLVSSAESAR